MHAKRRQASLFHSINNFPSPHVIRNLGDEPVRNAGRVAWQGAGECFSTASKDIVLTEEALRRRGYRSNSGEDADVVVIARASCVAPSGKEIPLKPAELSARSIPKEYTPDDSFGSVAALAMGSPDGLNRAGFEGGTARWSRANIGGN